MKTIVDVCIESRLFALHLRTHMTSECACADPEGSGDRGSGPTSLKNHKNIGFISNTGPDPL